MLPIIAFISFIAIVILWIIAMNLDEKFFGGRFLVRDKMTASDLLKNLENVEKQKSTPIQDWPDNLSAWFFDYFYNVALHNKNLDALRLPIVDAINKFPSPKTLSPQTLEAIEKAIQKLKS